MPQTNPTNRSGALARIAGVSMLSLLAAACAADSQRFAGFSGADKMSTGSLPPADVPGGQPAPSYGGGSYGAHSYGANPAGSGYGASSVQTSSLPPPSGASQSSYQAPRQSGFSGVRPDQVTGSSSGWTAIGGATVSVGQGDTVQSVADRYGVPPAAIRSANNLSGNGLTPGANIIIPVYNPSAAASAAGQATVAARQGAASVNAQAQTVRAAPQQMATSSQDRTRQVIAASRNIAQQPTQAVRAGEPPRSLQQQVNQANRGPQVVRAQPQAQPQVPAKPVAQPAPKPQQLAAPEKAKPAEPTRHVAAAPVKAAPEPKAAPAQVASAPEAAPAKAENSGGSFRWPARGRIIQGFNGRGGNEGINIALPEGTPVKAAEGGVVAYAGSELKGYGNLVLIRHENGWVSAYANNGELKVKRGDKVSRGQTVATSGQSGNVSTPQLHFELRKGSTPVDPLPHLAGG